MYLPPALIEIIQEYVVYDLPYLHELMFVCRSGSPIGSPSSTRFRINIFKFDLCTWKVFEQINSWITQRDDHLEMIDDVIENVFQ